ncbi:cytochrome c oxidase assembly protein COX16 homolog, mitochondrial-like isoform X2 [Daphnia pulicaria]|uniref:cytochrome c oxidase assembly protein COX16 homolog, mitochondrial-like isoform X2 n=1 Tax=Daphnia pulicaria TaxID=35523 RepID=UPI001EEA479B|nr:cytochrome c oxidase assembly protein COX16 homolog, mitochondrial-like isoform X2 [Daphnia pulicaria]
MKKQLQNLQPNLLSSSTERNFCTENRYRFRRNKFLDKEEAEKWGILKKDKSEVTLETEFEKVKQIDISDWENKRGPRPWEQVTEK